MTFQNGTVHATGILTVSGTHGNLTFANSCLWKEKARVGTRSSAGERTPVRWHGDCKPPCTGFCDAHARPD
jgi:hypothetical protein